MELLDGQSERITQWDYQATITRKAVTQAIDTDIKAIATWVNLATRIINLITQYNSQPKTLLTLAVITIITISHHTPYITESTTVIVI